MSQRFSDSARGWLGAVLALAGGLLAGWVDFNNDEPQAAVLLILLWTAIVGFIQPRKAWRLGLIVALSLPLVYLLGRALGYEPVSWPSPGLYATLLAIIPALIGTYAGVLLRKTRIFFKENKPTDE